jgi:phenylpyruvate tautomerase PptA (4-oxalocrotonate tautomerase family)
MGVRDQPGPIPFCMAIARIEVVGRLSSLEKRNRLDAVHGALVTALEVPNDDPTVIITEIDPESIISPGSVGDGYTIVQIAMFGGRSTATKKALYQGICTALHVIGVPLPDILIAIVESPTENWGVEGGTPASEVELGFQVDI